MGESGNKVEVRYLIFLHEGVWRGTALSRSRVDFRGIYRGGPRLRGVSNIG